MTSSDRQTPLARRLQTLSYKRWGPDRIVTMLGAHSAFVEAQDRLARYARLDRPVLLHGESGVGKELFARSLFLLSDRRPHPFVTVNCAEFQNDHLLGSALFGHAAGAFTGAVAPRKGLFERASGGILFLDEVSELSPQAQAALLRALGEGEIRRLGDDGVRRVDVRVVAATNQDLRQQMTAGDFRADLYHRLCGLHLEIPPLRTRGDDWRLLFDDWLERLHAETAASGRPRRRLSAETDALLSRYPWPGNVRELQAVADVGFCCAPGERIEPHHVQERLDPASSLLVPADDAAVREPPAGTAQTDETERAGNGTSLSLREAVERYDAMAAGRTDFWTAIHQPYMERDLNRAQVRAVIARGLQATGGQFVRLLPLFGLDREDYSRFMDFLRHHRLKPQPSWTGATDRRPDSSAHIPGATRNKKRPASEEAGR